MRECFLLLVVVFMPSSRAAAAATELSGAYESAQAALAAAPVKRAALKPHPLLGRIWDAAAGEFIDEGELMRRLVKARFILLGEFHDNAEHHLLQARVVRGLAAAGARYPVFFEMLPSDVAPRISADVLGRPVAMEDLAQAWELANEGDETAFVWSNYRPIMEAALDSGFDVRTADLSKTDQNNIHGNGWKALDPDFVSRYRLEQPLAPSILKEKMEGLIASHCGHDFGAEYSNAAISVQRARDAAMAESLAAAGRGVLVAGLGHTRSDAGVPAYLAMRFPAEETISLSFGAEVAPGFEDPRSYVKAMEPQHYYWFTSSVKRRDYCKEFLEQRKSKQ